MLKIFKVKMERKIKQTLIVTIRSKVMIKGSIKTNLKRLVIIYQKNKPSITEDNGFKIYLCQTGKSFINYFRII